MSAKGTGGEKLQLENKMTVSIGLGMSCGNTGLATAQIGLETSGIVSLAITLGSLTA